MAKKKAKVTKPESFEFKFKFDSKENRFDIVFDGNHPHAKLRLFFSSYLKAYLEGEPSAELFGSSFIGAINAVGDLYPRLGVKFQSIMLEHMMETVEKDIDEIFGSESEGDEEEEDCANCGLVRECDNSAAIAYRKANGIPRPKNGKSRDIKVK